MADLDAAGVGQVLRGPAVRPYLSDETETRNLRGSCDAVVLPTSTDEVVAAVRWAYDNDVPLTVRGGGTGYSGGAVPSRGGIVMSLERMTAVRSFDPLLWRMHVEAGVTTRKVQKLALQSGLYFPPDPGASEQSQIGGNIATNAGGPHAFKYGTTGNWVTGLEVVVPPGEVVSLGGPIRKDVAAYDLKRLFIGSEGTLGVITSAWLRFIPPPEQSAPIVAFYADTAAGVAAVEATMGTGLLVAAMEFLDAGALRAAPPSFTSVRDAGFALLCEVDGTPSDVDAMREELIQVLSEDALEVQAPRGPETVKELWRWREGMTGAVTAQRGGKVSEDIVVPVDQLGRAIEGTRAIGVEFGLEACSWGHAGDGNLHSTFLIDLAETNDLRSAEEAAGRLFALALELGGSITGEHGIGLVKAGHLSALLGDRGYELHCGIKGLFDPKGLLNPGKKL